MTVWHGSMHERETTKVLHTGSAPLFILHMRRLKIYDFVIKKMLSKSGETILRGHHNVADNFELLKLWVHERETHTLDSLYSLASTWEDWRNGFVIKTMSLKSGETIQGGCHNIWQFYV